VGVDAAHREELTAVPVGTVQRVDGTGVVEERVRVGHLGGEAELEHDVAELGRCIGGRVVADVDPVEDVVAESKKLGPPDGSSNGM
jgi:hypothetical protein